MTAIGFPRRQLPSLQELATRVIESRELGCQGETLARDLLGGFFDVCMRSGLDKVLAELELAFPPLEVTDRFALADDPRLRSALVDKLGHKPDFDDGGPRSAKPRQLADCLIATLSLTLTDEPDRTLTLPDGVRTKVTAALASILAVELAVPQIRMAIIAKGRELCDARYFDAFDRLAAQLDERGMRMVRQPKVSLDAAQAVQHMLVAARQAVVERAVQAAIDCAKQVLAGADADAAARIDLPITHRLTPRDVAIQRVHEARVAKTPAAVVQSLSETLTEFLHLAWRPLEQPVHAYAASRTFVVGDRVEHPKFGRGSVISCAAQRIEVEFAAGRHTLVHARAGK